MKPIFKSSLIKDVVISYVCMIVFPVMIILGMVFLLAGRVHLPRQLQVNDRDPAGSAGIMKEMHDSAPGPVAEWSI